MRGKEYYKYGGNVYEFIDHGRHKDEDTREWITTVVYHDGEGICTREVGDFYERFTQIPRDSVEVVVFNLKRAMK